MLGRLRRSGTFGQALADLVELVAPLPGMRRPSQRRSSASCVRCRMGVSFYNRLLVSEQRAVWTVRVMGWNAFLKWRTTWSTRVRTLRRQSLKPG